MSGGRRARRAAALLGLLALGGCGPRPAPRLDVAPVVAGGTWGSWRTLRAEHRVTVTTRDARGQGERRALRGVIAVERPGRLRLRALGPGGITLFDLLYTGGEAVVLRTTPLPGGEALPRLLQSIAGDLAAAYDLAPRPADRRLRLDGAAVVVEEGARTVRLGAFQESGRGPAPARMTITHQDAPAPGGTAATGYTVDIEAEGTALDEPLDPALFER